MIVGLVTMDHIFSTSFSRPLCSGLFCLGNSQKQSLWYRCNHNGRLFATCEKRNCCLNAKNVWTLKNVNLSINWNNYSSVFIYDSFLHLYLGTKDIIVFEIFKNSFKSIWCRFLLLWISASQMFHIEWIVLENLR